MSTLCCVLGSVFASYLQVFCLHVATSLLGALTSAISLAITTVPEVLRETSSFLVSDCIIVCVTFVLYYFLIY